MGSRLGSTLANVILSYREQTWIEHGPSEFIQVLYRRYVGDIFV